MDRKTDYRTPRDRVDDALLRKLLNEDAPSPAVPAAVTADGGTNTSALAIAYVKPQEFGELFSAENGFTEGTIFKDLALPFGCSSYAEVIS